MKIEPIFETIGQETDFTGTYRVTSPFFPPDSEILFRPSLDPYSVYDLKIWLHDEVVWDLNQQLSGLISRYRQLETSFSDLQQQHIKRAFTISKLNAYIKELEDKNANTSS